MVRTASSFSLRLSSIVSAVLAAAALAACGGPDDNANVDPDVEEQAIGVPDASVPACTPESDADFCAQQGKECGLFKGTDRCGGKRAVDCGSCGAGQVCGIEESNACGAEPHEAGCGDYLDDDGDGLTDCADTDCASFPACAPRPAVSCSRQSDCGDIVDEMVTDVCLAGTCQAPGAATSRGDAITAQVGIRLVFEASLTGTSKPRSAVVRFVDSRRPDGSSLTCADLKASGNCRDMQSRSRIDDDASVNQVFRTVYALDFSGCVGSECVFPGLFATLPRAQGMLLYGEAWYGPRELNDPTGQCAAVFCSEGQAVAADGDKFQVTFQ